MNKLFATLFAFSLALQAQAQIEKALNVRQSLSPQADVAVGDVVTLTFEATILPTFHVYSSIPSEGNPGAATSFELDEQTRGIKLQGAMKEKGKAETYYDEVFETNLTIFHEKVTFTQNLLVTEANPHLEGYLRYQICDDSRCIPGSLDIRYDIQTVAKKKIPEVKSGTGEKALNTPVVMPPDPLPTGISVDSGALAAPLIEETASVSPPTPTETAASTVNLWTLILEGFLFGLASVLTPCIFPMIPLTVSYFTKRQSTRARGIRDAVLFGVSIVGIYTGLAFLLSVAFGPAVMQQVANSPWFNLFFFVLLIVFALSFMGMFEIMLPSSWGDSVSKASDKGGILGIFLTALALAIVSFSCTGPIVATALGDAFRHGKTLAPILTMLSFSTALALPFAIFAVSPNALKALPKSGGWLNAVKVTLGMLELALAFIYLSRADLTMQWGLLSREAFIGAWIAIFGLLGFYLLGKIRLSSDSPVEKIPVLRFLLAMCSFWFVLYLIPGLWGAPLKMLGGYMPNNTQGIGVLLQEGQATAGYSASNALTDICTYPDKKYGHLSEGTPRGFCAFYDLDQALDYARKVNKPLFLDFTGHTCANCRYLEQNAWIDPALKRYITEEYVLVSLYTDDQKKLAEVQYSQDGRKLRNVGNLWLQYEMDTYNSNAQPLYVLIDHEKKDLLPPMGYNPPLNIAGYRDFFQKGLEVFRSRRQDRPLGAR